MDARNSWKRLLNALQKQNISLYILAKDASDVKLDDGILKICFSPEKAALVAGLKTARNWDTLTEIAKREFPGITLLVELLQNQVQQVQSVGPEENAFRLFGDKLKIED